MDKARAKRDACWRAAQAIRASLESGWDLQVLNPEYSDDDVRKVEAGLDELIAELERRGHQ